MTFEEENDQKMEEYLQSKLGTKVTVTYGSAEQITGTLTALYDRMVILNTEHGKVLIPNPSTVRFE